MRALILVDIQNDFLPGGALAVPEGDDVVAVANALQDRFGRIVATQDWHPAGHKSFASSHRGRAVGETVELRGLTQILWPDHCVQGTPGSELAPGLRTARIEKIFHKGVDPEIDSYSGFYDNAKMRSTRLGEYLRDAGVDEVYVCGLATDYCVEATVLDAVQLGFRTFVVIDGCRAVDLQPGDGDKAVEAMRSAGAAVVTSDEIVSAAALADA